MNLDGQMKAFWDASRGENRVGQRQAIADLRSMATRGQPYLQGGDAGPAL